MYIGCIDTSNLQDLYFSNQIRTMGNVCKPIGSTGKSGSYKNLVLVYMHGWESRLPIHYIESATIEQSGVSIGNDGYIEAIRRWNERNGLPDLRDVSIDYSSLLSVVTFHEVWASGDHEAIEICREKIISLLPAMSIDQGGRPTPFCYRIVSKIGDSLYNVKERMPSRTFIPVADNSKIGELLALCEQASENDPVIRLLLSMFYDAKSEQNLQHKMFKMWQILELCSKRHQNDIPDLTEDEETYAKSIAGKNLKDLRLVQRYIRHFVPQSILLIKNDELYKNVRSAYLIRNYVAHEGVIPSESIIIEKGERDVLDFYQNGIGVFEIQDWAKSAIIAEINAII